MGQYYRGCILGNNKKTVVKCMKSYDYDSGAKLMEHSWMKNPFVGAFESMLVGNPQYVIWAGDYADECKGLKTNVYQRCIEKLEVPPEVVPPQIVKAKYIVNHDKQMFVDKTKVPDADGWKIHPLPLLTCDGNGRGGGDFRGESDLVGSWARDLISVEAKKPKGYTELKFDLVE